MEVNDLKKIGSVIVINNEPYQVIFSQHARTAQRRAFVRTKLRNLSNGQILEKTFNTSDKIEGADVEKSKASFLYAEKDEIFFMDTQTYEQFSFKKSFLEEKEKFLKEGLVVEVLIFNKKPINIDLPKKIDLKVIEAPPGIKGDSATSPTKIVTLETGAKINVPIFIKNGDVIKINTETGGYVERI
ncbi:MAG: elongation factor P [Patescibacteria group bacterium]|nr:elongation factor P [Patescibacteria group bacterium]